jgi:hypothetical protein
MNTTNQQVRALSPSARLLLFISFTLGTLYLTGCASIMRRADGEGEFIPLPPDEAARAYLHPSDLGYEWSKKGTNNLMSLAELGLGDKAWVKLDKPIEARQPLSDRALRSIRCYFVKDYRTWIGLPAKICFISNGQCRPVTLYFLLNVTCDSQSHCNTAPPNKTECFFTFFGRPYQTSQPADGFVGEHWFPCDPFSPSTTPCDQ